MPKQSARLASAECRDVIAFAAQQKRIHARA
jgi:hypothetical protein